MYVLTETDRFYVRTTCIPFNVDVYVCTGLKSANLCIHHEHSIQTEYAGNDSCEFTNLSLYAEIV